MILMEMKCITKGSAAWWHTASFTESVVNPDFGKGKEEENTVEINKVPIISSGYRNPPIFFLCKHKLLISNNQQQNPIGF